MSGEIDGYISKVKIISGEIGEAFGELSAEQLSWKPDAKSWSVGQCIDHLDVTNSEELPAMEAATRGEHTSKFFEKLPWLPGFFGRFVLKSVDPDNVKKNKAPGVFKPTQSDVSPDIVDKYLKSSKKIIETMKASEGMEIDKMIITSPVGRFVTYSLEDTFKMVVFHDRRHFNQAKRLMEMQGFPA